MDIIDLDKKIISPLTNNWCQHILSAGVIFATPGLAQSSKDSVKYSLSQVQAQSSKDSVKYRQDQDA